MSQIFKENMIASGDSQPFRYNGSKGVITVYGNFDTGVLRLLSSPDGADGTYIADPDFNMTAPGNEFFAREVPLGLNYKFNLSGDQGDANITIFVNQGEGR